MTVSYSNAAAVTYSIGNPAPATPAHAVGDLLVLVLGTKPDTASATLSDTSWTRIGGVQGGAGSQGNDAGPMRASFYYKIATTTTESPGTITIPGNSVSSAQVFKFVKTSGLYWDVAFTGAADTSTGSPHSAVMPENPGLTVGDLLFAVGVIPTDVSTPAQFSAETVSAPGMTTVNLTEHSEWDTASGQDMGGWLAYGNVVTGTATGAPTVSATAGGTTTNVSGPIMLLRIRETNTKPVSASDTSALLLTYFDHAEWAYVEKDGVKNRVTNPSFEDGLTNWSATNATASLITDGTAWDGLNHAEVSFSAQNNPQFISTTPIGLAGQFVYGFRARLKSGSAPGSALYLRYTDVTGATSTSTIGITLTSSWQTFYTQVTASSTYRSVEVGWIAEASGLTGVVELDAFQFNQGSTLLTFDPATTTPVSKTASDTASLAVSDSGSKQTVTSSFVGATTGDNAQASTNLTVNVPAGVQDGDQMLFWMVSSNSATHNTPSGWTVEQATFVQNAATRVTLWKRTASSEPASYTVSHGSSTSTVVGSILAYRGVTIRSSATSTGSSSATSYTPGLPSGTLSTDWLIQLAGARPDSASNSGINTPSGFNSRASITGTGGTFTAALRVAEKTGNTTAAFAATSGTGQQWAGSAIALIPSSSGPATPTLDARINGINKVKVKTTNATSVRLKVGTDTAVTTGTSFTSPQTPNSDGYTTHDVSGLTAGTVYYYRVEMTDSGSTAALDTDATVGRIKIAPTGQTTFSFNAASCGDGSSAAMLAIANREDDLFLHLGDMWYADGSGTGAANFRTKMLGAIQATNDSKVYATTSMAYIPGDHDGGMNDNYVGTSDTTARDNFNTVYREIIPNTPDPATTGIYHTFVWGRVRFIMMDCRSFKSPNSWTDNSSKTILGTTQKQWVKDTITNATEPLIFMVGDVPWKAPVAGSEEHWGSYSTERLELANHINSAGKNVVYIAGDMHALAADDGSDSVGNIASFQSAPLRQTASIKAGPYDVGPYPASGSALVEQYGRFVITDSSSSITVDWYGYSADNTQRLTQQKSFTLTTSKAGSESTAITATDTAAIEKRLSVTDGGSLAAADVGSLISTLPISASDSASLTVTESTSGANTGIASDTSGLVITDASAITKTIPVSDTASLTVSETSSTFSTGTASDTASLTITDISNVTGSAGVAGSETNTLGVTDTSSIAVFVSRTDGGSLAVSETVASAMSVSRTDTASLAITDTAVVAVSLLIGDTASLAITESSAHALTLSRTESTAITIGDASAAYKQFSASDTASLIVTDSGSTGGTADIPGTDTSAVAVSDQASIVVSIGRGDTGSVSVAETVASAVSSSRTDAAALTATDASTHQLTLTRTDTSSVSTSDSSELQKVFGSSDTASLTVNDVAGTGGSADIPGTESTALAVTDTSTILVTQSRTDTAAITATDVSTHQSTLSRTDTASLATSEALTHAISLSRTDGAAITATDASALFKTIEASDTDALQIIDIGNSGGSGSNFGNESTTLGVADQASIFSTGTASDTSAITVSDAAANFVTRTMTDTAALTISDASATAKSSSTTDTTALTITDTSALFITKSAADTPALTITESANTGGSNNIPGTDIAALGVTDTRTISVTLSRTDTASLATTETNAMFVTKTASDTLTIAVAESNITGTSKSASDTLTISLSDLGSAGAANAKVKVYYGGQYVVAVFKEYKNGEWRIVPVKEYTGGTWV